MGVFKSNKRSEDSFIDLAVFFCFLRKVLKCPNNYRCAIIHVNAFMNALRCNALYEFN